eukprot:scaffold83334_cov72-Phaeocystis_antarctica.AAC.1
MLCVPATATRARLAAFAARASRADRVLVPGDGEEDKRHVWQLYVHVRHVHAKRRAVVRRGLNHLCQLRLEAERPGGGSV